MLGCCIQPSAVLAAWETDSVFEDDSFELFQGGVEDCVGGTVGGCEGHESLCIVAFGKRTEDVKDGNVVQRPSRMSEFKSIAMRRLCLLENQYVRQAVLLECHAFAQRVC